MAFYKFYLIVQVLLMYQILPLVCSYQYRDRDMDSAGIQNSSVTLARQLLTSVSQPRLFTGLFLGIKAIIKAFKAFTLEIKGGICIVKYMLILEDPQMARLIDMDAVAKWLHAWRLYLVDLLPGDRVAEEAAKVLTRQRIEEKVRESLAYDDDNLFAIPRNITNYANEGESYNSVYPKCLRTSAGKKMTNLPCEAPTNRERDARPRALASGFNQRTTAAPPKYYATELRLVENFMSYMELLPDQLLSLNMSHCLNFYTLGLLTRFFASLWG